MTTLYCYLQRIGQIGDCVIQADCWSLPGDKVQRGIVFHAQENADGAWDKTNFDAFGIDGETSFIMLRVTNGKKDILLPSTFAEVIKTKGLSNHLKVAIMGSDIEAYINGLQVATYSDPAASSKGYVGLALGNTRPDSPVFFDNFLLYNLK
jgi:hypothetical protein